MKSVEKQLKEYAVSQSIQPDGRKIRNVLIQSKEIFYEEAEKRQVSYFEFMYQQIGYIRKRWWVLQFLLLFLLGWLVQDIRDCELLCRLMGVFAPLFVILVMPELWKSRSFGTMEIEGVAYFSLRQIYVSRMLAFAVVDGLFLSLFTGMVSVTTSIGIGKIMIQFFLPMIVTCCICFRSFCCRYFASEYIACTLSFLWSAVWILLILDNVVYKVISVPVWMCIYCIVMLYFIYVVRKMIRECEVHFEALEWRKVWN